MNIEVPGSSTENPQDGISIRKVEDASPPTSAPSESVAAKQDASQSHADFLRDLNRATERVREEPS